MPIAKSSDHYMVTQVLAKPMIQKWCTYKHSWISRCLASWCRQYGPFEKKNLHGNIKPSAYIIQRVWIYYMAKRYSLIMLNWKTDPVVSLSLSGNMWNTHPQRWLCDVIVIPTPQRHTVTGFRFATKSMHTDELPCFQHASNAVRARSCYHYLSVRPSVRLSNAWIATKRDNILSI